MNLTWHHSSQARLSHGSNRGETAFTMVEIALSIAVVAFALVAILGVLPTGLQVQRDNREDTIIQQEAAYFIEAIRSGATNLTELTNYVDSIMVSNWVQGNQIWTNSVANERIEATGREIIGLLSTPKFTRINNRRVTNNLVVARVRAVSGSAIEKPASANPATVNKDFAFNYLLTSEIIQATSLTNLYPQPPANSPAFRNWNRLNMLGAKTYEVRLTFRWPILPNGTTGGGRKVFRTMVAGDLELVPKGPNNRYELYRFAASEFEF